MTFFYTHINIRYYITIYLNCIFFHDTFNIHMAIHVKPYFLFPNVLKRWSFQKNSIGIWSFLYYQEKWYFFFPKILSYRLDGKWKMIFLEKINGNMKFSCNVLKRWSFQKNHTGIWSFFYFLEIWYFFLPKIWSYPFYFHNEQKQNSW